MSVESEEFSFVLEQANSKTRMISSCQKEDKQGCHLLHHTIKKKALSFERNHIHTGRIDHVLVQWYEQYYVAAELVYAGKDAEIVIRPAKLSLFRVRGEERRRLL